MDQTLFDKGKADIFAQRMMEMLNDAALALMVSVGHRTGLFDALRGLPPSDSVQIARRAGLNERYVREWLGAMVTGGVVECNPQGPLYALPEEHAAWLTRTASPDNLAVYAQYIPLLGTVEEQIVECFHRGGGVPYSAYKGFHRVQGEDSAQSVTAVLSTDILPLVPGLLDSLVQGIQVLDVGCGSGHALNRMAETYPESRFTGYDLCADALAAARREAAHLGLRNVRFETRDLAHFAERSRYDLITAFDVIHDQADPAGALVAVAQALRPGGVFLMQDIAGSRQVHKNMGHPAGTLLYAMSCLHCVPVSLAQQGAGLGALWGEETALEMLDAAGFIRVTVNRFARDFQNVYYVAAKD